MDVIPPELIHRIIWYLPITAFARFIQTSKQYYEFSNETIWNMLEKRDFDFTEEQVKRQMEIKKSRDTIITQALIARFKDQADQLNTLVFTKDLFPKFISKFSQLILATIKIESDLIILTRHSETECQQIVLTEIELYKVLFKLISNLVKITTNNDDIVLKIKV